MDRKRTSPVLASTISFAAIMLTLIFFSLCLASYIIVALTKSVFFMYVAFFSLLAAMITVFLIPESNDKDTSSGLSSDPP